MKESNFRQVLQQYRACFSFARRQQKFPKTQQIGDMLTSIGVINSTGFSQLDNFVTLL